MEKSFSEALKQRRTYYSITNQSPIPDQEIECIINMTVRHVPSAFNSQSTRVVLLLGESHKKLWQIVKDALKKIVPAEAFAKTEEKIDNFEKSNEEKLNGDIDIKNLTYNYPGYIETVLENINIDIKKGESLGIIGVVGSGKTTLMNLLLKLYDVERGKIFIDGKDINDIPVKTIRDNICYITQDNFLFSATLKENINLFKDEYKDEDIEDSTKQAMIYDEISHMDDGINTVIGEKGIDLSGGQKQRLAIARAFVQKTEIILLDEATSSLDNETQLKIQQAIENLQKEYTILIIAHRLSTVRNADRILMLSEGKIIAEGNHSKLIKECKKYRDLYENEIIKKV